MAAVNTYQEGGGVGDAVAEIDDDVAVVPPGHDAVGSPRVLECLTCGWAVVYGVEVQARVGCVVATSKSWIHATGSGLNWWCRQLWSGMR